MYVSAVSIERKKSEPVHKLPPEVATLFSREQEIAGIVYRNGVSTARSVECQMQNPPTNASIRTTLNRLVRKGILLECRPGKVGSILYLPALTEPFGRYAAVKTFADDFYDGALDRLVDDIGELFARAPTLQTLLDDYHRSPPPQVEDLVGRMREIASIVYCNGMASILDVQAAIPEPLAVSGIRTAMNRLVTRGIVRKRRGVRHQEVIYIPGIVTRLVRQLALKRLIDMRFDGSAEAALQSALQALND